ncbi:MAG TPA: methyltransferase domain-containing protein [Mycobacteriales bacterium]|nr:methyltransferase domain-containing protein [Mycobacteriales bacterium]
MGFDVVADAYMAFMGRYSEPLGGLFVEAAGVRPGDRALDVGCGPGALTARLAGLLGPDAVAAVDPSSAFVAAARERCPGVDVRPGAAEDLPFADGSVDVALAQLVVHFMADPVAGLAEMGRVTRPGGVVAACVWDYGGGTGPLSEFWAAVRDLDPGSPGEGERAGTREGHLAELFRAAGLAEVESGVLTVTVPYESFEQWWHPYTLGVGPAGDHVAALSDEERAALREQCRRRLPEAPFEIRASAWFARGRAGKRLVPGGD